MDYNGILLIDKPEGITSFKICEKIRRKFKVKKVGHAGTLDPFATGLLILGIGKGTKLLQFISEFKKHYTGIIFLGEKRDTYDITGKVIDNADVNVDEKEIYRAVELFKGVIKQKPPIYSAIKKNGKPLYKYARKGEHIEVKERFVFVEQFEIKKINIPEVEFSITCSKGTYIRSIANDLGEHLGTFAYLKKLRRTAIGTYNVKKAVKVSEATVNDIIPFENALDIRKVYIKPDFNERLMNGSIIEMSNLLIDKFFFENLELIYVIGENCLVLGRYFSETNNIKPEIVYKKSLH